MKLPYSKMESHIKNHIKQWQDSHPNEWIYDLPDFPNDALTAKMFADAGWTIEEYRAEAIIQEKRLIGKVKWYLRELRLWFLFHKAMLELKWYEFKAKLFGNLPKR